MAKNLSQKNFFLISFLPALAYWYLEANYPVKIAVTGGLILATCEVLFEYLYTRHVHTLSKFNFFLIAFLGGLSLLGEDGLWFKLQPMFTGLAIGAFMVYRLITGDGLMWEMANSMPQKPKLPKEVMKGFEKHMVFLFGGYGLFMGYVALYWSTDRWVFFKTVGFYIAFTLFAVGEIFFLRKKVRELLLQQARESESLKDLNQRP